MPPRAKHRYKPNDDDRRQVKALVGFGLTIPQIAVVMSKGEATIKRHFKTEIRSGKLVATSMVAQSLFKTATEGKGSPQVSAAIIWLKTQARWSSLERVHVSGLPPPPDKLADLRGLSREELHALESIARRLEAQSGPDGGAPNRSEVGSNGVPSPN